jgi:hypothetical protein
MTDTQTPDFESMSDDDLSRWLDFVSATARFFRRGGEHEKAAEMTGLVLIGVAEQERRGIELTGGGMSIGRMQ